LCHAALARPAGARAAFLAEACGDDTSLRAEVESLVAGAGSSASFLETPLTGVASPPSLVGCQLGAYRLEAAIGAGGMGDVYRAKDTRLGRDVAVKILPAAFAADPQRRTRFEREARAIAALNHPNICTVHDVGHDQGIDFLVMELVEGESLAARLKRGPLPLDEALARAIEILDALDKAHRHGIIHRDLKPGNVMLARTGSGQSRATQAKLLDFGLARIVPPGVAGAVPTDTTPRTETGAVLGTLQYMAPEQIEGRSADARTDIFAFGALLYEMVIGRRAFEGSSTAALMAAILREVPPPVHPSEVGRVVRRCLAKDPLRRYQSARDLLNDLEEVRDSVQSGALLSAHPPSIPVAFRVRSRAAAWFIIGVGVGIGSAVYIGWNRGSAAPAVSGRFQLQPPAGVSLLGPQPWSVLAMSPDGRWVAFRGFETKTNEPALYLRDTGELAAKKIAPEGLAPFFSPDSRWLGFFAGNGMHKVSLEGGQPQRIGDLPETLTAFAVRGASWGDDGTIIFTMNGSLWRASSDGGAVRQFTHPASPTRHHWPHVLPGSATALFALKEGSSDRWSHLGIVSLKTGEIRTLPALSGTAPRYLPGGHLLYSSFGALHAVPFDRSRLEVTGEPVKVLDDVQTLPLSGSVAYDVSASGSLVYIPADLFPIGDLLWLDRQGRVTPIVRQPGSYIAAALDPRGRRLATAVADDLGEADLWIYDLEGGGETRLTTGMRVWSHLAWSPDGKWIFFTSFRSGNAEVFRVPSAGGGSADQLTFDVKYWEYPTSVSPDGKTLLFWRTEPRRCDLMRLNLEPPGTPTLLKSSSEQFCESNPQISPTGFWVAYESNASGSPQIHVRGFPGPGPDVKVSTRGGSNPIWSRDGGELFYQLGSEIWVVTVEPGETFRSRAPRMMFKADFPQGSTSYLASGPVADRFLAVRREPLDLQLIYVPNWLEKLQQTLRKTP
jgi:serine/threonine-protein kinase